MDFSSDAAVGAIVNQLEQRSDGVKVVGVFHAWCVDANGNVEWDVTTNNALTNEGANWIRDIMFKGAAAPGDNVHIGLATAAPSATSTLATVTEATGGAYARKPVTNANWNSATQGQANNTASPASWTASGTQIANVSHLFVCNVLSGTGGKLLSWASISGGPYTVNVGSTLNVTYTWTIA